MNKKEHLMVVAMEECAEIQQAIAKSLRFGLQDHRPETPTMTNEQEILTEYYQLMAVMEMLQEESLHLPDAEVIQQIKQQKKAKVLKYMAYAKEQGCIS